MVYFGIFWYILVRKTVHELVPCTSWPSRLELLQSFCRAFAEFLQSFGRALIELHAEPYAEPHAGVCTGD